MRKTIFRQNFEIYANKNGYSLEVINDSYASENTQHAFNGFREAWFLYKKIVKRRQLCGKPRKTKGNKNGDK